jgi:hypothetical protein
MIIIAGYSLSAADQRDAVVEAFVSMVKRAREQEGCLDIAICATPAILNV